MFSILGKKSKQTIGLDITSTTVKLLELAQSGSKYRVESYAVEPLSPNAVVDKTIADVDAVGDAIRKVVARSGTKATHAAVAVSGAAVITKVITMPAGLNDRELESQISLEADQYIPYPLEEVNLDFEIIGPNARMQDQVDVLLAACRSENVDARVAALELAGLKAAVVDIESYAMELACSVLAEGWPNQGEGMTVAVADVGATNTTLSVLHNNTIIYTREQNFGGLQLTEEIQRRYGLSMEEAGMAKRQGGLPDNYVPEVLEPFREAMAQQINRALQFFYSASPYNHIDLLVLAGGTSALSNIDKFIEKRVGVPTEVANPFTNMAMSNKVKAKALSNDAPAMMIACGLALRSFD
ncbi:MAG: pilus assembly protein PilM [Gammaproteobacteria bacterium]|nr:pilus assembly protein PilM [Gammaproteobacteria bacterium]